MKGFVLFLLSVSLYLQSQAQDLPPVYLPAELRLCDTTPWKLVFLDNFDGDALDRSKWHSYNVYPGRETDDWEQARANPWTHCIWKDANVVVSGGTCKLIFKQERATWKGCEDCPEVKENYTGGILESYYSNAFNAGRFEARIRMPTFTYAHCAFWLWPGDEINEIDIAEAYGDPFWPYWPTNIGHNRRCNYSLHSWPPKNNPHKLRHEEIRNRYPNQTWWDRLRGRYFKQDDWHVYACEWDSTQVSFYLDGNKVNTIYKYHRGSKDAVCSGENESWTVRRGFPYNTRSGCNIRLNTAINRDLSNGDTSIIELGVMEIDYVKVWQRHPEAENRTVIEELRE